MVGASPDGRYVVIAGGMVRQYGEGEWAKPGWGAASKAIEIYDRETGRHIELPGALQNGLPHARFGGSVVWVQDQERGIDRIFFIGGSSAPSATTVLENEANRHIDVFDLRRGGNGEWLSSELRSARMGPGAAVQHLPGGEQRIVVAGGTTGTGPGVNVRARQLTTVETIDPLTLEARLELRPLPPQRALSVASRDPIVQASHTALVLGHHAHDDGRLETSSAHVFGFSQGYSAGVWREPEQPGPKVVVIRGGDQHVLNATIVTHDQR